MTAGTTRIRPRQVRFDWRATPLHWIAGDPFTAHTIDVLHLLLPAGERWFVEVCREALPLVGDPSLREDLRAFMGQEAIHSRVHTGVLDHLRAHGLETAAFTRSVDWMFERLLDEDRGRWLPRSSWRRFRLAIVAAAEHFTCVLGKWILEQRALEEAGADPVMLDLLRWHGAEEVEHRSVAFDTFQHLGGRARYLWRLAGMAVAVPTLLWIWDAGARHLIRNDPSLAGRRFGYRDFVRATRAGRLPSLELLRAVPRYLRPSHHPAGEASTETALRYLASSPAAAAS
jgi:hypothetical protein